jgi:8-oxo-dGTP diphosphatase
MELQVGVKALAKNGEGKYLLLKRSTEKYKGVAGSWDIPGGRIVPGSSLEDNLRREIKEETGLQMMGKPKLIGAQDILRVSDKHIVRLTYAVKVKGKISIDQVEVEDYKWLTMEEILKQEDLDIYLKEIINNGD